jgi:hypothetical protein
MGGSLARAEAENVPLLELVEPENPLELRGMEEVLLTLIMLLIKVQQ